MKCASPNLDVARLPLCCFSCRKKKKKMAGWQSGVKVFWSEEKVCNWGPWAGSLHCTSRRIIAWGYKKKEEVFFQGGGILFSMPNYCFSIPSFLPPFLFQNTTGFYWLIHWTPWQLRGVCSAAITGTSFNSRLDERSLCLHNRGCNFSQYFVALLPSEVRSCIVDFCI